MMSLSGHVINTSGIKLFWVLKPKVPSKWRNANETKQYFILLSNVRLSTERNLPKIVSRPKII